MAGTRPQRQPQPQPHHASLPARPTQLGPPRHAGPQPGNDGSHRNSRSSSRSPGPSSSLAPTAALSRINRSVAGAGLPIPPNRRAGGGGGGGASGTFRRAANGHNGMPTHHQRRFGSASHEDRHHRPDDENAKLKLEAYGEEVYSVQEDSLRNDLSQAYLNTGRRPQNFLQGTDLHERFSEYPKLSKLLSLHSSLVAAHAHPPTYLKADLSTFPLTSLLPTKFDCILIDPPLEEYARSYPSRFGTESTTGKDRPFWTWDQIAALPIPSIAANPGFIWLWVGSGKADENGVSGLDKGREILAKWGYRRCEDIVWLKTNKSTDRVGLENEPPTDTVLTHTKEHCLMGIRGTVRRSTDGHFAHCNVDTDVIVWEGDLDNPLRKPPELYNMIENFCLGTRRVELFGNKGNLRRGWLTLGLDVSSEATSSSSNGVDNGHDDAANVTTIPADGSSEVVPVPYSKESFDGHFVREVEERGGNLVPSPAEIEALRPRSPGAPTTMNGLRVVGGPGAAVPYVPGMKMNPQGIGRHTNRSGTPSASQQLELEKFNEQRHLQQQQQQVSSSYQPQPQPQQPQAAQSRASTVPGSNGQRLSPVQVRSRQSSTSAAPPHPAANHNNGLSSNAPPSVVTSMTSPPRASSGSPIAGKQPEQPAALHQQQQQQQQQEMMLRQQAMMMQQMFLMDEQTRQQAAAAAMMMNGGTNNAVGGSMPQWQQQQQLGLGGGNGFQPNYMIGGFNTINGSMQPQFMAGNSEFAGSTSGWNEMQMTQMPMQMQMPTMGMGIGQFPPMMMQGQQGFRDGGAGGTYPQIQHYGNPGGMVTGMTGGGGNLDSNTFLMGGASPGHGFPMQMQQNQQYQQGYQNHQGHFGGAGQYGGMY